MRKIILLILAAMLMLSCQALAGTSADTYTLASALNGHSAARTDNEIYMAIPDGDGQMLLRIPTDGSQAVCVDRADSFDDLMSTQSGVVYLKTTNGSSAIMRVQGNLAETVYSFGADSAQKLTISDDLFLVLLDGRLHSIDENTDTCLKLSSAQMLDYVVSEEYVYYVAGGDMVDYTVQLEDGSTISDRAGCIYKLNLSNGNTALLLKSGAETLRMAGNELYFYNMADAYAREGVLRGNLYGFNLQDEALDAKTRENVIDFYPLADALVAHYSGKLNRISEAGTVSIYAPGVDAIIASDGNVIYVWEPASQKLVQVNPGGLLMSTYSGALSEAVDAASIPEETPVPDDPFAPAATGSISDWFDEDTWNDSSSGGNSNGSSSSGSVGTYPTPIGQIATAKPAATATAKPTAKPTAKATATVKPTATPAPTATATPAPSGTSSSYIFPHSNTKKLTEAEILGLSRSMWSYARNEIYARHGYVFSSSTYANYFAKKTWYTPGGFSTGDLNSIEWYNMDLIKAMEKKYPIGSTIQPTTEPTATPTTAPTADSTVEATISPTTAPTATPTPTIEPTVAPTATVEATLAPGVTEAPIEWPEN